jgi:hypothetical protein
MLSILKKCFAKKNVENAKHVMMIEVTKDIVLNNDQEMKGRIKFVVLLEKSLINILCNYRI